MANNMLIERHGHGEKQTLGSLFVQDECGDVQYTCKTLEPAWKDNQQNSSCIPEGEYKVVKRHSATFGHHFHVLDVDGRSWILIHVGNYRKNTRGCILVGEAFTDINGDGLTDVVNSGDTLADLLGVMPKEFNLKITTV